MLVTAVQAIAEEPFNLKGIQSTTHPCGVFVLVNGPLARELNINGGYNCFGQGWRANATTGRATAKRAPARCPPRSTPRRDTRERRLPLGADWSH